MGSPQIFVMNADGSNVTQLTNNNNDNQYPTWGPNGQQIAFVSGTKKQSALFVMNSDGSSPTQLTNAGNFAFPTWWLPQP